MPSDKMLYVAEISSSLLMLLGIKRKQIKIFRSKGLLAHLLKRRHYKAAKYLDFSGRLKKLDKTALSLQ